MDEKQRKQLQIINNALIERDKISLEHIREDLVSVARGVVEDLTAFEVVQGHSEKMMAANAIMQIANQILLILCNHDE